MKKTLILVAVVVVAFLGYAVIQKSRNTAQSTEIISDKTEWKTHIHSAGDYSFEYPTGWFINDSPKNGDAYVRVSNYDPEIFVNDIHAKGSYFKIEIYTLENKKQLSINDWIAEARSRTGDSSKITKQVEIIINGKTATAITQESPEGVYKSLYLSNEDKIVTILLFGAIEEFHKTSDAIIHSFAFSN